MFPVFLFLKKKIISYFELCRSKERRKYYWWAIRFMFVPRYTPLTITLGKGIQWECSDIASFLSAYKSIFVDEVYAYTSKNESQLIIDCGANIGLSVLFFKTRFPDAKVIAFEADPQIFGILDRNIKRAGFQNVTLLKKAVWIKNEDLFFKPDHADGGRIGTVKDGELKVEGVDFNAFLQKQKHIDMLKMDIEGAENDVLVKCFPAVTKADKIFFEYHSNRNERQVLGSILEKFEKHGYHYQILTEHSRSKPFVVNNNDPQMDLQVDFFLWKEKKKVLL